MSLEEKGNDDESIKHRLDSSLRSEGQVGGKVDFSHSFEMTDIHKRFFAKA